MLLQTALRETTPDGTDATPGQAASGPTPPNLASETCKFRIGKQAAPASVTSSATPRKGRAASAFRSDRRLPVSRHSVSGAHASVDEEPARWLTAFDIRRTGLPRTIGPLRLHERRARVSS